MNQTSVIAAFLLVGFIVWIVLKGQLAQYRDVVGI